MPVLGLTMEEGTVAEWLKQEGDAVAKDEPLLTVEMDKGTQEVPSPVASSKDRVYCCSVSGRSGARANAVSAGCRSDSTLRLASW